MALALSASALAAQTPSWTFTTLDFPGFASVNGPLSINDNGDIVGFYDDSNGALHGYLLPAGGDFVSVDFPGSISTMAMTINDRGEIVGTYWDAAGFQHGFLLKDGTFSTIDFPGAAQTTGTQFELGGSFADPGYRFHGFALIDGQYVRIDVPGARATETYRIDNYQTIVGGYVDQDRRTHGYVGIRNP